MTLGLKAGFYVYDEASTETDKYDLIGGVMEMSGLDMTIDTSENTQYGPDEDDWRTFEAGMKDAGELSVTIRARTANKAKVDALRASGLAGETLKARLKYPSPISQKADFDAVISKIGMPTTKDAHIDITFAMKISGKPAMSSVV